MIKEFGEALVEYRKVNVALLAVTLDPDMKANLKTEYCMKVNLAVDQLDLLYNEQETLKAANPANIPDPTNMEENRRLKTIKVQQEIALGNIQWNQLKFQLVWILNEALEQQAQLGEISF